MQFWVYILRCSGGSFYTGHTDDLAPTPSVQSEVEGRTSDADRQP